MPFAHADRAYQVPARLIAPISRREFLLLSDDERRAVLVERITAEHLAEVVAADAEREQRRAVSDNLATIKSAARVARANADRTNEYGPRTSGREGSDDATGEIKQGANNARANVTEPRERGPVGWFVACAAPTCGAWVAVSSPRAARAYCEEHAHLRGTPSAARLARQRLRAKRAEFEAA